MKKDNKTYCSKETDKDIDTIMLMMLTSRGKTIRQIAKKLISNETELESIILQYRNQYFNQLYPPSTQLLIKIEIYICIRTKSSKSLLLLFFLPLDIAKRYFDLSILNKANVIQRAHLSPSINSKYYSVGDNE